MHSCFPAYIIYIKCTDPAKVLHCLEMLSERRLCIFPLRGAGGVEVARAYDVPRALELRALARGLDLLRTHPAVHHYRQQRGARDAQRE